MRAFRVSGSFGAVANWVVAYRLLDSGGVTQGSDDGIDEGCGERALEVLERFGLHGLLLVLGRWQDYGATPGLELFGTRLYGIVVERSKDLLARVKSAMGLDAPPGLHTRQLPEPLPQQTTVFSFCRLPPLPEPRVPQRYAPGHFLADTGLQRPASLPNLFRGGDLRQWLENDRCLRQLPEAELRQLRALRRPEPKTERVLRAVALLRGKAAGPKGRGSLAGLQSSTLRAELLLTEPSQVPLEAAQRARRLLDLDAEALRRASSGAACLHDWASGIVQSRLVEPEPSCDGVV